MNIQWGIADPNAFQRGFQQTGGMVDGITAARNRAEKENALRTYAANPNAPGAINALAMYDPKLAVDYQMQTAKTGQEKQKRDAEMIGALARDARDPQAFDAAVDQVVAMGYPEAAQFKGKFSPGLRAALMAAGGVKDEQQQPTSLQRNYEFYKQTAPELAPKYLENQANPVRFLPDGVGGYTPIDPSAFRSPAPDSTAGLRTVTDQATYDAIPAGEKYRTPDGTVRQKPGGPAASPPATFP